jgi:hypothetical protein
VPLARRGTDAQPGDVGSNDSVARSGVFPSRYAGEQVRGPLTASAQAQGIEEHTLETTGGLPYAELDREDPRRDMGPRALRRVSRWP